MNRSKEALEEAVILGVVFAAETDERFGGQLFQRNGFQPGERMRSGHHHPQWLGAQEFKLDARAAWLMGLAQIPFIINFLWSIKHGRKVASDNPWDATTLEWATPTPPPHGNFTQPIVAYRAPYDYSVTGAERDFCPQNEPMPARFEQRKDDPALAALART
jgi:hypothetical protein